jgi:hypothetical protein
MDVSQRGNIMIKKYLCLITILLTAAAMAFAQGAIKPRDADEAEGWQIYNQYKTSVAAEAKANNQLKQARVDVSDASFSTIGAFGSDPSDRARVTQLRQQINAEMNRQAELVAKWESKFYWRYGDLTWSDEKIYDAKTKRQMDRIEFALIYFPFNPKNASTTTAPLSAGSTSLTLQVPGYWGVLSYTISGAKLETPTGSDRGNVGGRQYKGVLSGTTLTVSGTATSTNPSSGAGSMDYYELNVSVVAGKEHKEYNYIASKGELLSKSFALSVPVTPGSTGSFGISLLEQNANYGPHGWVVGGSLEGSKTLTPVTAAPSPTATPAKPVVALAGAWSCSDGGTYKIKQSGTSITWEAASPDGGRTWSHTFVGTIQGDKIVGRFKDHPPGRTNSEGELSLRIVGGSKLEFISSSVPFGGRVWKR